MQSYAEKDYRAIKVNTVQKLAIFSAAVSCKVMPSTVAINIVYKLAISSPEISCKVFPSKVTIGLSIN